MSHELNAEIASQVMGWTHIGDITKWPKYNPKKHFCKSDQNDWWLAPGEEYPTCGPCYCLPANYSTTISDAWLVVEEMKRRSWLLHVSQSYADDLYTVTFTHEEFQDTRMEWHRSNFPEAVCHAALGAVKQ